MDTEPPRLALSLSAVAGAAVWGMFHAVTAFMAGEPLDRRHWIGVGVNVAASIVTGALCAYFLGPAIAERLPIASLREPEPAGFLIGWFTFEAIPFANAWGRRLLKQFARGK